MLEDVLDQQGKAVNDEDRLRVRNRETSAESIHGCALRL